MFNSGEMFQSDELENRWFRVIEIFAERFLKNIGQKFWFISYESYAAYLKYGFWAAFEKEQQQCECIVLH